MAPTPSTSRRPFNTRGRSARKSAPRASSAESPSNAEPPLKKRRYVPGGPGGGGRYVDNDGTETFVDGGIPGGHEHLGPRGRVGRENAANGVHPVAYPRPRRESRRERAPARPRFSSAAAAAAAVVHGDGFKPREERGWEEFHQDLDIDAMFPIFSADEVDGIKGPTPNSSFDTQNRASRARHDMTEDAEAQTYGNGHRTPSAHDEAYNSGSPGTADTNSRRRLGRPPRRADSMLKGIGTPEIPKVVPLPGFNPRERLTLPKPSFRSVDPFKKFEQKGVNQLNYVSQALENIGYQASEVYLRPERSLIRVTEGNIEDDLDLSLGTKSDGDSNSAIGTVGVGRVEYDMDEQDTFWLETINEQRNAEQVEAIKPAIFEITMTKIEKEWHAFEKRIPKPNPKPPQTHRPRSSSAAAVNGELAAPGEEQDSKCAICDDGDCENTNAIVFCDGCDLAVHQECYGVPFIPEGQWLCRKCQLIGRGTPTCIFCPNTDGAFKQTNASRWSHLLCAIWIPEVSIGNTTFMEPVMDVEKVPKQRWKLTCYICRQKMGACIQCGNKNCYIAFHVTCARRAKLFLKMKSTHGGPASLDASVLKAFCDKHVPADWRREHDVDHAIVESMDYYRYTMRGRLWADSQQSALTIIPAPSQEVSVADPIEESSNPKITINLNPNKRKNQTPKVVWRLPSGAPVIPQTVYNSVESSLARFTVRKRKEFAAEMCKYWTLKREARRGAALLKRLQLQMETFTSMEITRRNFVGMGAAGGVRLQRRIDFADSLLEDVDKLRQLCSIVKQREYEKREDAMALKTIVDTVYFPITLLLSPILNKAQSLDSKGVFANGFSLLHENLSTRSYNSVIEFSKDFGAVFTDAMSLPAAIDTTEGHPVINGGVIARSASQEYKQRKLLAKRIIKTVQSLLVEALRRESELRRTSFEKELQDLDSFLDYSIASRRDSINEVEAGGGGEVEGDKSELTIHRNGVINGVNPSHEEHEDQDDDIDPAIASMSQKTHPSRKASENTVDVKSKKRSGHPSPESMPSANGANGDDHIMVDVGHSSLRETDNPNPEPPTPPLSSGGDAYSLFHGGVPWYMETFDPQGTTILEERWTGRELVRGMSEDLSDMDEDELSGLVDADDVEDGPGSAGDAQRLLAEKAAKKRKAAAKRKRWR